MANENPIRASTVRLTLEFSCALHDFEEYDIVTRLSTARPGKGPGVMRVCALIVPLGVWATKYRFFAMEIGNLEVLAGKCVLGGAEEL